MMPAKQIIAVANQKGGVGKTTTAVNLAACLGEMGKKTLLVDMDPQSNASSACGIDSNNVESSVYECLIDSAAPVVFPAESCANLFVLPATVDLAGAEFELMDRPEREYTLKGALERVAEPFDFMIIDSPPSLGLLTVNTLVAADWLLIPVQAEYFALEGLSRMVLTVQRVNKRFNPNLKILGIVTTLFDSRTNLAQQVVQELRRAFPKNVFQTVISRSVRLSEAPSFGKPIIYYDARSAGAEQYRRLSEEVTHACEKASAREGIGQPAGQQ